MNKFTRFIKKTFNSKRLNFMGVKYAGKSQILQTMGCPGIVAGHDSQADKYPAFEVDFSPIGKRTTVFIHGGKDYGGELQIFRTQYAQLMRKGDFVVFVVDATRFFNDDLNQYDNIGYRMSVLQRLDLINSNTPRSNIDKFSVVLTHADEFESKDEIIKQFQQIVNSEALRSVARWIEHYYVINAKDSKDVLSTFSRIFGL